MLLLSTAQLLYLIKLSLREFVQVEKIRSES